MKNLINYFNYSMIMLEGRLAVLCNKCRRDGGFGLNELLGIAAGIIVAGLIFIPRLKDFATAIMTSLSTWWGNIQNNIFTPIS